MAKMDKLKKKTDDEKKKVAVLTEFKEEAQVKPTKEKTTFFREPFFSTCFVCKRGFQFVNDEMAKCGHTFSIKPSSAWVGVCYMEDGGFVLDESKIAEVEEKYNIKVSPPVYPTYKMVEIEKERLAKEEKARKAVEAQSASNVT